MDVLILSSQDGDWEGLFVRGNLIAQDHEIRRMTLLKAAETHNFTSGQIRFEEVRDEDEEDLSRAGSFPQFLDELKHEY